jgi:hypothetical protein
MITSLNYLFLSSYHALFLSVCPSYDSAPNSNGFSILRKVSPNDNALAYKLFRMGASQSVIFVSSCYRNDITNVTLRLPIVITPVLYGSLCEQRRD